MSESNVFFTAVHEALVLMAVDVDEISRRVGTNPQRAREPGVRLRHEDQLAFWRAAEQVTGDPEIGLHVCPHLSPFAGDTLTHLMVSSPTVGLGLQKVFRYLRLLSDHLTMRIEQVPGSAEAQLVCQFGDEHTPRHSEISFFYGFLHVLRLAAGRLFQPSRIELRCSAPADPDEFARTFGCPVSFGAAATRCQFPAAMLDLPLPRADAELVAAHEAIAQRRMKKVLKHDTVEEVRGAVARTLEQGSCTLDAIAALLGRSVGALRKELDEAGSSFNHIVAEERQSLAKRLLAQTAESIECIARVTGFSERSAFFRAFKKWTGMTPNEYRSAGGEPRP